ncbi:MAG: hypothetical protein RIA71_00135 [Oceanicaulis sp.]
MAHTAERSIAITLTNSTLETFRIKTVRIAPEQAQWVDNAPSPWSQKPVKPAPGALVPLWAYIIWEVYTPVPGGPIRGSVRLNALPGDLTIAFETRPDARASCTCDAAEMFDVKVQQGGSSDPKRTAFNITLMKAV